jgi:hypothetical protein
MRKKNGNALFVKKFFACTKVIVFHVGTKEKYSKAYNPALH